MKNLKPITFSNEINQPTYLPLLLSLLISFVLHAITIVTFTILQTINIPQADLQINWSNEALTAFAYNDIFEANTFKDTNNNIELPPEESPTEKTPKIPRFKDLNPNFKPKRKKTLSADSTKLNNNTHEETQPQNNENNSTNDLPPSNNLPPQEVNSQTSQEQQESQNLSPEQLLALKNETQNLPQIQNLGPGNAILTILIKNDRLRTTRFADALNELYKSFPDFRITVSNQNIDPLNDIDALLIATSNPQRFDATFLAIRHHIPENALKQAIENTFPTPLIWSTHNEKPLATPDPSNNKYPPSSGIYQRVLYFPSPILTLYISPQFLSFLENKLPPQVIENDENTPINSYEEIDEPLTILQSLTILETNDSPSKPALFIALNNINNINLGPNAPTLTSPVSLQASLSLPNDIPELYLRMSFNTNQNALDFIEQWPELKNYFDKMPIPGLTSMLNDFKLAQQDTQIIATTQINPATVSILLLFARKILQRS